MYCQIFFLLVLTDVDNGICVIIYLNAAELQRMVVSAQTISRVDYCSSVSEGLSIVRRASFQHSLNIATRLLAAFGVCDSVDKVTESPHWLPIAVAHQIPLLSHNARGRRRLGLEYIVASTRRHVPYWGMLICDLPTNGLYNIPRIRTRFGCRAFFLVRPCE